MAYPAPDDQSRPYDPKTRYNIPGVTPSPMFGGAVTNQTPVPIDKSGGEAFDPFVGKDTSEGIAHTNSPVDDWTAAMTPATPTTAPAAPQRDYRNSNDLRSQLNEWAGAVPYSDPSVTDGSYDWLGAINDKGGLNDGNMDYWRSRVQSDPNDYTGQNPNNWYRNEDASRAAGNAPQTDPRNLTSMAQTTQTGGASWGPAPQPDWVPIAGGGWVPPNHPEAANAIGPPGIAPTQAPAPETNGSPGPGWVNVNGGWVPPDHPLAAGAKPTIPGLPENPEPGPTTQPVDPDEGMPVDGPSPNLPPHIGDPADPAPAPDPVTPAAPGEAPAAPATVDGASQQMLDMLVSRMSQSDEVDPNDPNIRNRTDTFQSRQDRARQGFLREQAEASGPYGNLNSERRNSAEEMGQNVSAFEQNLIDTELTSRRNEIQTAMTQLQSHLTEQQRQAMTKELADLDRALAQSQMSQQNTQFGRSLDESRRQSDASRTESARQADASRGESGRQFDTSTAEGRRQFDEAEAERARQFNAGEEGQNSRFNRQMNDAMEQYLKSIGQRAYEFDTSETNRVLG